MSYAKSLRNYKRSIGASTIDDFKALTRILKTHTHADILNSYDITSIIAVNTEKQCMNEGCNNTGNFAISQRFESGKYYTYHLCKECLKKAYIVYADEIIEKIDEAMDALKSGNVKDEICEVGK